VGRLAPRHGTAYGSKQPVGGSRQEPLRVAGFRGRHELAAAAAKFPPSQRIQPPSRFAPSRFAVPPLENTCDGWPQRAGPGGCVLIFVREACAKPFFSLLLANAMILSYEAYQLLARTNAAVQPAPFLIFLIRPPCHYAREAGASGSLGAIGSAACDTGRRATGRGDTGAMDGGRAGA
jgi:hypothetical protein